jgi:hypothetical protein
MSVAIIAIVVGALGLVFGVAGIAMGRRKKA